MQTDNERTHTQDLAAAWGQTQAFPTDEDCDTYGMDFRSYLIGQIIQGAVIELATYTKPNTGEFRLMAKNAIALADEVLLQLAQERADKSQEVTHG